MQKKVLLIINPVSGRRESLNKLALITDRFCKAGYLPAIAITQNKGEAYTLAKNCTADYSFIVCAGGDGTLNEVISGMMANTTRFCLGYLPSGSTNDLANSLKLKKDVLAAVDSIIEGNSRVIDIGRFNDRYFNYVASFGAFTDASYNAPQEIKNLIGHAAYVFEGFKSLGNIRPYHIRFEFDDKTVEGDYIFGAISNSTSLGGVLKLKDELVQLNDGLLELLLIRFPENFQQFNKIVSDIVSQNYFEPNGPVQMYHTSKIKVITNEQIDWTLDGEKQTGNEQTVIENVADAIEFFVPKKAKAK